MDCVYCGDSLTESRRYSTVECVSCHEAFEQAIADILNQPIVIEDEKQRADALDEVRVLLIFLHKNGYQGIPNLHYYLRYDRIRNEIDKYDKKAKGNLWKLTEDYIDALFHEFSEDSTNYESVGKSIDAYENLRSYIMQKGYE
jgi:hypothetical protein